MKVTIEERGGETVALKIEGRLFGPMVPELHRAWEELLPSLGTRKLSIDLRGVTFLDAAGKRLLSEIHARTGAEFLADTPLTKYFAEEAQQEIRTH